MIFRNGVVNRILSLFMLFLLSTATVSQSETPEYLWKPNDNSEVASPFSTGDSTQFYVFDDRNNQDRLVNCFINVERTGDSGINLNSRVTIWYRDVSEATWYTIVDDYYLAQEFSSASSSIKGITSTSFSLSNLLLEDRDYIQFNFTTPSISGNHWRPRLTCHSSELE